MTDRDIGVIARTMRIRRFDHAVVENRLTLADPKEEKEAEEFEVGVKQGIEWALKLTSKGGRPLKDYL